MRKLLFAVIVAAAFVGCSQSPKTQVDINSVLVEHNKQVHKIFDYLRGRDDGSLLIDSIADKFNMKFEFANAEPQRTFKQSRKTDKYVCLFKPTADNDTVYISVPIMPLNEQLLKQMEETYKRDLANSNK